VSAVVCVELTTLPRIVVGIVGLKYFDESLGAVQVEISPKRNFSAEIGKIPLRGFALPMAGNSGRFPPDFPDF
jgi:hypothetical protein